jgi:uncharacterized protein YjbJ (UPF0337 family)
VIHRADLALACRAPAHGVRDGQSEFATEKECVMSGIDKMKNKAEELGGKGKEAVGEATDNRDLQAEGQADQASGNLKQAGEKIKDVFK